MKNVNTHIITTQRLLLREINPTVLHEVHESFSDEELKQFFGLSTETGLQLHKEQYRQGMTMFGISFSYFQLVRKDTESVIGWCGYHKWYTRHARAELGYVMEDATSMRNGFMKEALGPILRFGFESLKLHRVEAMVAAWNEPSLKLLKANGFVEEGNLREHYFENNIFDDSLLFSLLVSEFKRE